MGGLIPDSFIEELLGRADIVELIERHIPLKRNGREFQACCPFHDEKTPSFTVSPQKQFYHCFGCGAHGSAIGFLMNYEGLEFIDAVEELARLQGMTVPRDSTAPRKAADGLLEMMETAARWYQEQLRDSEEAIAYLKKRGLSGEVSKDYGIGFAPAGWNQLMDKLGGTPEKLALLQRGGMLSEGKSGSYDKFRHRIMFPIHDRRGRVIGFGGRALGDDGPKYLNSPETELFHKGRELYGLYLARKTSGRLDRIIVVEGYMDVVALAQFGFGNTVATLGTAVTGDQVDQVFRASDEVIYCFDGDRAGRQAAWRAVESTLPRLKDGRQARFLFLPEGEDPDSMVRRLGKEEFEKLLATAQPLSEFYFRHFTEQVDMNSIDGRARLVELSRPALLKIPEGVFRDMMLQRLEQLARHQLETTRTERAPRAPPAFRNVQQPPQRTPIRLAMAHLVQNPGLAKEVTCTPFLPDCDLQGMEILRELIDFCAERPNMSTAQLLELWREHPAQMHLKTLATWSLQGEAENLAQEFRDALTGLELQWVRTLLGKLPRPVDSTPDEKQRLLALQQQELVLKQALAGELR
ncbi:MAG TPA: DNA primase [Xanthomonadales bacterium]|nr:DNA primase [Xanthomonadales bacterium]